MNAEEIDKIIEESLAEGRRHKGKPIDGDRQRRLKRVRMILNTVFMIGFVAALVLYFVLPGNKTAFFITGFGALLVKVVEFIIRFMA